MNLLINEPPLQVLPSLAKSIGLNQAIILQQMHYWLIRSEHEFEGRRWIYNSISKWNTQFPFWSKNTITRVIDDLVQKDLLFEGNFNKLAMDRTKWYAINYETLNSLSNAFTQNGEMHSLKMGVSITPEWVNPITQNGGSNTIDYTENTQEKKNSSRKQAYDATCDEMILTEHFIKLIMRNRPSFPKPNINSWCKQFDLILRKDKRHRDEVVKVINFVQSNRFWMGNCLSPKKLREKFDQLAIQMMNEQQAVTPIQKITVKQDARPVQFNLDAGED